MAILEVFLVLFAVQFGVESKSIAYNTSQGIVTGKLNVHLVPHTHDDVGWLKTVDQYFVGSNNSIQGACVRNVLDSLVPALLADRNRKFIYVEQASYKWKLLAFFQRWWREQGEIVQDIVKKLVYSGQLELINGGMCMHDEAATHYIDMIDQTTLGHRFIKQEFDQTPRIGWQIDPFGHSAVQAYLLGAEVGFDSLFFARIDYQDREKRKGEKTLEFIFSGAFPANYEPPSDEFYFEVNDASPIVQDDMDLFDYNVQDRVDAFVAAAMSQDGRVNALYSTPSIYTDAKFAANQSWPLKTNDFFPYADRINAYWTGYFTSRPALKRYVRTMSAYYLAARQLEFFKGRNKLRPNTDTLADALAIAQHHDAVSGTEKQHVANDYAKRLSIGYVEAEELVSSSLGCLVESTKSQSCGKPITTFEQCPLLNISYCPPSQLDFTKQKSLVVLVYNPLGWKREDVVRIPVNITFVDASGGMRNEYVKAYLGRSPSDAPKYWLAFVASAPPLGYSSYTVYNAKQTASSVISSVQTLQGRKNGTIEVGQGNLKLIYDKERGKLTQYTNKRNLINASVEQSYKFYKGHIGNDNDPQVIPQSLINDSFNMCNFILKASGAYVFRPNGAYPINTDGEFLMTVLKGPVLNEVHQQINPWISQNTYLLSLSLLRAKSSSKIFSLLVAAVYSSASQKAGPAITRVYKVKEHAEVEFTVGPIPVGDGIGKEIVTQITTNMKTNKTFYTDSNGRDFIKRIRDYREDWDLQVNQPVSGNYYPVGIYMQDSTTELSVLVDRSLGGSSILDGQIELMLHRRLLYDDSRGVAEALNELVCVDKDCRGLIIRGSFYFRIDPLGEGAKWRRITGQEIYSPFLLAFAEETSGSWAKSHVASFSGIAPSYSLPDNVALITLQELEDGQVLLRLAHLFEISKVTEMNLSANQERAEMEKRRRVWRVEGMLNEEPKVVRGGPVDPAKLVVELSPMEIRTFVIDLE
ncbi:hypothetical protein Syun_024620 [Stephania yunnanensis]|uniref:Alpha-mannosidase n=1 Tax=Stephania yunnanensis TaxID=152371 RepID=A0AAP0NIW2_9MAGN